MKKNQADIPQDQENFTETRQYNSLSVLLYLPPTSASYFSAFNIIKNNYEMSMNSVLYNFIAIYT